MPYGPLGKHTTGYLPKFVQVRLGGLLIEIRQKFHRTLEIGAIDLFAG